MKISQISEKNWRFLFLFLVWVSLLSSCSMPIKIGRMPNTVSLVSALQQKQSTKEDVFKLLGLPQGYGMMRLSKLSNPRVVWFYEGMEGISTLSGSDSTINGKMLLIFFDGEKYDGYMWFPLSLTMQYK